MRKSDRDDVWFYFSEAVNIWLWPLSEINPNSAHTLLSHNINTTSLYSFSIHWERKTESMNCPVTMNICSQLHFESKKKKPYYIWKHSLCVLSGETIKSLLGISPIISWHAINGLGPTCNVLFFLAKSWQGARLWQQSTLVPPPDLTYLKILY